MKNYFINLIFILIVFVSCSKEKIVDTSINQKSLDLQVLEAYKEGKEYLESGDALFAAKNLMRLKLYSPNQIGLPDQH